MAAERALYPTMAVTVDGVTLVNQAFLITIRMLSLPSPVGFYGEESTVHFHVPEILAPSLCQSLEAFMQQRGRRQWVFDIPDRRLHLTLHGILKTWSIFYNANDSCEVHLTVTVD